MISKMIAIYKLYDTQKSHQHSEITSTPKKAQPFCYSFWSEDASPAVKAMLKNKIHVINSAFEFNQVFKEFQKYARLSEEGKAFMIGFDLEFINKDCYPLSHAKVTWVSKKHPIVPCVLQIAAPSMCLVINLTKFGPKLPKNLLKIIQNKCWIKYGVSVDNDLQYLSQSYELGHCGGCMELTNFAELGGIASPSLKNLTFLLLGINIGKKAGLCDWSEPLNTKRVIYAAQDAIASLYCGIVLVRPVVNALKKGIIPTKIRFGFEIVNDIAPKMIAETKNYVGKLQEICMVSDHKMPAYTFTKVPAGFICRVTGTTTVSSRPTHSKKLAKQCAARMYLIACGHA
jgi:hypothetical protein